MTSLRSIAVALAGALLPLSATPRVPPDGADRQPAAQTWPAVGGDLGNTRYSTLARIDTRNVSKLGAVWMSAQLDATAPSRATPVARDGLMFFTAGAWVYALNAKTGTRVWRYRSTIAPASASGDEGGRGNPSREGVAIGDGLVYVGLSNAYVIALREQTGELLWSTYIGDVPRHRGQGVSGAPTYANGLVFTGLNADFGLRGRVVALDAKTGRQVWEFWVIPGPGEPGHDTWPGDSDVWKRGGGAIWLVGAADPDLGLVYFGTGNGVPQYGGEVRPGDNLYLCSIVALDMRTGALKWHFQLVRHDVWEADVAIAPVLFDAEINGRRRRGIAAMRADGYLFTLDRESGKPLTPVEDRPVPQDSLQETAATQPFPVGADRVLPDCDEWRKQPTPAGFELGCFFTPPSVGKPNLLVPYVGMRVTPMAFSPQTGYFYVSGQARLEWLRRSENPYFLSLGFSAGKNAPGLAGYHVMAALDSRTNTIVWRKEFRVGMPGGAMTTAGGLVFQAAGDGNLQGYDAKTGEVLWNFQTGARSGGPPTTYEIDGEQYVAVVADAHVWAFKLGGTIPPLAAPAAPAENQFAGPVAFSGPILDTNLIETASLERDMGVTGHHYAADEYAFSPYRARVKAGTEVSWQNNGTMIHTVVAQDGSWTTGPLGPAQVGVVKFDKPGNYIYICKEHPWAMAQLIVVP